MGYNGKHLIQSGDNQSKKNSVSGGKYAKNNPILDGAQRIIQGLAILILLAGLYFGVNHIANEIVDMRVEKEIMAVINSDDNLISILNNYSRKCDNDDKKVLVNEIISYINETDCSFDEIEEAKNYFFQCFLNEYAANGFDLIHEEELNKDVYDKVTGDPELMGHIKEYAKEYDIPEGICFGLTFINNEYNENDIFNFSDWAFIDSSQNVYNFKTNEKNNLLDQIKACRSNHRMMSKYSCMVFRQCLKEAHGVLYNPDPNTFDAIDYYIDKNISINYKNFDENMKAEHEAARNRILSAAINYSKKCKTSLSYKFDMNNEYTEDTPTCVYNFIYDNLEGHLDNDFNDILSYVSWKKDFQYNEMKR